MEEQNPVMSDDQLATYLQEMEREAISFRSSDLADEQAVAIDFYEGKPFGDEEPGRSQVVVPVVQEVVDYMGVSVLRTFVSGDRVVEFEPRDEDTADVVEEATEGVNYAFMREQDGYKVLHDWLKTGLIERLCAVETMCIEDEKRTRRTLTVSEDELALMVGDGAPIIQVTDNGDGSFVVKLEEVRKRKRYVDMPIPNYEFLFSPRTRHEDESEYLCHRTQKSLSDLIEMGFDRAVVESLPAYDNANLDEREDATWDDEWNTAANDRIPGLRKVTLRKEYARIDYDGDGVAELLRVYRVDRTILEAEEVDEQPFVVFTPFPRAHRMVGNSLADKVMDIQRNKSVILRQSFDAMYQANDPKLWLDETTITDTTIEDLLTKGPGVIVRGRGAPPQPMITPVDISKSLTMLEYLSGEQESRTGITRLNQGLDADAMNKTATGMALQSAQGQQMEEFVARNFAEALARLFMKKLRLMIEHGEPLMMRVDGEFKQANPSLWTDDVGVTIRVGLGSGKREARLAARMQVAQMQAQAYAEGTGLVDEKRLYNTGAGIVRDSGLGDPNDFFIDPDSEDFQQPEKGDPEAAKAMAEVEKARAKAAVDLQIARENMEGEMQIARERMREEIKLAREKAFLEAGIAQSRAENDAAIKGMRAGGSLAA